MALTINSNIASLIARRNLTNAQNGLDKAIGRLSTGLRINSAADDAAGLAISDRLTAQIRGLDQAQRNANDGASALQTADGALGEVSNLLQRARELAVQSANDSNSASDRSSLNAEVSSILSELDRLAGTVQFNSRKLLDGTYKNAQFQIGANAGETISFSIGSINTSDLGAKVLKGGSVSSTSFAGLAASSAITVNGVSVTIGAQDNIEGVISAINNKAGDTFATASKNSTTVVSDSAFVGLTTGETGTLTLNGVSIALSTGNADATSSFVSLINQYTNQTGVVASSTGTASVTFTRNGGGSIAIMDDQTGAAGVGDAVASTAARTFNAGFTLSVDLDKTLSVVSSAVGDEMGFTSGVVNTAATAKQINGLSVSNVSGANDALQTIDFGLSQLSRVRGAIGAVQSRFSSALSSLGITSENLSAARARIQDADVASETAQLTRNQILIQAGVSVLGQANQLPSLALSLLG